MIKGKFPGRHWWMLAFTGALFLFVGLFVDLKPEVGENFFFSSSDPQYQEDAKIDRIFPSGSQLIVSVASADISSARYLERLARMTPGESKKAEAIVRSALVMEDGPDEG
jgi:hypothetical protein